jgi:uncharacterized membrane protein YfcA
LQDCRRHPFAERPIVDWDMVLIMEPMTILGALAGGTLNKVLPLWLTTALLCTLLWTLAINIWRKCVSSYRCEGAQSRETRRSVPEVLPSIHQRLG